MKDGIYCTLSSDKTCHAPLSQKSAQPGIKNGFRFIFSCTDQVASNYNKQLPFLKDLEINHSSYIKIEEKSQNFARIRIFSFNSTPYYTQLRNNKWQPVHIGHDLIPCNLVRKTGMPNQVAHECYDQKLQTSIDLMK